MKTSIKKNGTENSIREKAISWVKDIIDANPDKASAKDLLESGILNVLLIKEWGKNSGALTPAEKKYIRNILMLLYNGIDIKTTAEKIRSFVKNDVKPAGDLDLEKATHEADPVSVVATVDGETVKSENFEPVDTEEPTTASSAEKVDTETIIDNGVEGDVITDDNGNYHGGKKTTSEIVIETTVTEIPDEHPTAIANDNQPEPETIINTDTNDKLTGPTNTESPSDDGLNEAMDVVTKILESISDVSDIKIDIAKIVPVIMSVIKSTSDSNNPVILREAILSAIKESSNLGKTTNISDATRIQYDIWPANPLNEGLLFGPYMKESVKPIKDRPGIYYIDGKIYTLEGTVASGDVNIPTEKTRILHNFFPGKMVNPKSTLVTLENGKPVKVKTPSDIINSALSGMFESLKKHTA